MKRRPSWKKTDSAKFKWIQAWRLRCCNSRCDDYLPTHSRINWYSWAYSPPHIHRPKSPPWGFKTSNTASWKSQEVSDMCSPLPSDPAASPTPKARIDFMWTGFHPCRGSPASAAACGADAPWTITRGGWNTGSGVFRSILHLVRQLRSVLQDALSFSEHLREVIVIVMLGFPPPPLIPHGWFLHMS